MKRILFALAVAIIAGSGLLNESPAWAGPGDNLVCLPPKMICPYNGKCVLPIQCTGYEGPGTATTK